MYNFARLYPLTKNFQVLFVEDDAGIRESVVEILEHYFHHIDTATDGMEGLMKYRTFSSKNGHTYDLVITDIQMPRMNGVEMVREIKKLDPTQQIIVLSAHQESHYLLDLINLGIAHFVLKPIEQKSLFTALFKVAKAMHTQPKPPAYGTSIDLGEGYRFDREMRTLYHDGHPIKLTKNELLMMDLFSKKFEKICSVDEMVHFFFDQGVEIFADNIRPLISRLRRKLPEGSIESLYGIGYKLTQSK